MFSLRKIINSSNVCSHNNNLADRPIRLSQKTSKHKIPPKIKGLCTFLSHCSICMPVPNFSKVGISISTFNISSDIMQAEMFDGVVSSFVNFLYFPLRVSGKHFIFVMESPALISAGLRMKEFFRSCFTFRFVFISSRYFLYVHLALEKEKNVCSIVMCKNNDVV